MDKNSKNKIISPGDFLRYNNGEMTGEERNDFERNLQKDPFAEEASEGISFVSAGEAEKDIRELEKKLAKRISRRSLAIYYRTAAAIAVIVTISVIYHNRISDTADMVSKNETAMTETSFPIAASEPLKDISEKSVAKNEAPKQSRQVPPTVSPSPPLPVSPSIHLSENQQAVISTDEEDNTKDLVKEEVSAVSIEQDKINADESEKKMAMSRVAGVSAQFDSKGKDITNHIQPQPVNGIDSFNIYLEKNTRNPQTEKIAEKIVILSFTVNTDSTISDFKIIESPGQAYSREAKRLIKEGPAWKPAMNNGKPAEEEYRIKIVFR